MKIKVIAFGQIAEIIGSELFVEAQDTTVLKSGFAGRISGFGR